ncbi:MAG TPA: RDD family protein [Xanthomonadaceae bacterium]|nr:RDD family protein [Xanthomonadaceae bacterium]
MQPSPDATTADLPTTTPSATPAHLGWRLLAITYDLLPLMALWFATSGVELLIAHGRTSDELGAWTRWLVLGLLWLVTGAYMVVSWRRGGATLGMRAWRLKVLAADGRPASLRALCLRYAVATISLFAAGLGFVWSLFDRERQCWHDIASGTRFVRMDRAG